VTAARLPLAARCAGVVIVAVSAVTCASATPSLRPSGSAPTPNASVSRPPASPSPALTIDPRLLDVLPPAVGGVARGTDGTMDAEAFGDPTLPAIASAGAVALYLDAATGDFALATLLRLRGATLDETAFRAYRDSFDRGACSAAGGVARNAEAELGGRRTFIAACAGGLFTYHALLPAAHALLSISSGGGGRLGEKVAAAAKD
jgi:hypothetical protein